MMRKPELFRPDVLHEECGVFGIWSPEEADLASLAYNGLFALQHRGQESAGIVVYQGGVLHVYRQPGLVSELGTLPAFKNRQPGTAAVGHVRYATTGSDSRRNIQPLVINHHRGSMALAHNGNLTNARQIREALEENGAVFHSTTDTEVIAYQFVQGSVRGSSPVEAAAAAMERLEGAYSLVIVSAGKLFALRDPFGFRPLCLGKRPDGMIVAASESCALDAVGAEFLRDVEPGEIVTVDADGIHSDRRFCGTRERRLCVFEYIYFARPDSVIDGSSVTLARQRAGAFLAQEHPVEADVVIGVPDSGLDAAIGYAAESGIPYAMGFTKNKYVGRTFIEPTQGERENSLRVKLNPIRSVVEGKRVVLIDDSIVRGTTCRYIISLLRRAGVREIHMRISAPPFVAPCFYGTDIDRADRLIANHHTIPEIAQIIGVDSLGYLSTESVKLLTGQDDGFCTACFGGEYPTAIPPEGESGCFDTGIDDPV